MARVSQTQAPSEFGLRFLRGFHPSERITTCLSSVDASTTAESPSFRGRPEENFLGQAVFEHAHHGTAQGPGAVTGVVNLFDRRSLKGRGD